MSNRASTAFAGALGAAALAVSATPTFSHVIVGPRFFPTTLTIHDPGINDELSLPTFAYFGNPDGSNQYDFAGEWQKRITPDFSVSIGGAYTRLTNPGAKGWQALETAFTFQLLTIPESEFVFSAGVEAEWGRVGNPSVGAEPFTEVTPRIFFGKGFGDLPTSLDPLRPFAITGQLGISIPTRPRLVTFTPGEVEVEEETGEVHVEPGEIEIDREATLFRYGFTLQYSLPYMNSNVLELPDLIKNLTPVVEFNFATPIHNVVSENRTTRGIIAPGIIYSTRYFQIAVEALIPVNRASGRNVGVIAGLNFYLDDIFPDSIGRPIFAPAGFEAARSPF